MIHFKILYDKENTVIIDCARNIEVSNVMCDESDSWVILTE